MPENLRKDMTFVPVDRIDEVWKAAMGLKLDMKALDLAEARELLEEAGELIARAHGKAAAVKAAATDGARPAPKPAAKPAGRPRAAGGNGKGAGKSGVTPGKAATGPKPKPRATPARPKGAAKKTTAARGRSGRKR